jgi:hypothetical protein
MFNKLFNRSKTAPGTPSFTPPAPLPAQPVQQAPATVPPALNRLEAFREEWEVKETTTEVIEGDGGNTDWGLWTNAVENEEKSFAPTAPMPLTKE